MTQPSDKATGIDFPLSFHIMQLNSAVNAQSKAIISRCGDLNVAQWRIIRVVAWGIADTTTLVRKTAGIDKGQFSKTLTLLVEAGYVELLPYPQDKRQRQIVLTDKGQAEHARLGPELDARQNYLMACLSPQERETIKSAILTLTEAAKRTDFTAEASGAAGDDETASQ